jgi:dihydrofolate reductase
MRRIRYSVAASLDGYIAGPDGEFDWIPMDPDIDFPSMYAEFDTLLMGRHTFEIMSRMDASQMPRMRTFVFSRTLAQRDHPDVTVVNENAAGVVSALRAEPGKDIWLFGGGQLFRSLLEADLVDTVEVAVVPVLLGKGIPLLQPATRAATLALRSHRLYPKSGIVFLEYSVKKTA